MHNSVLNHQQKQRNLPKASRVGFPEIVYTILSDVISNMLFGHPSHPTPRRRGIGKDAEARFVVRKSPSTCSRRSSCPTASSILSCPLPHPWWSSIHVHDHSWFSGIPHCVHLHPSYQCRATRHTFSAFVLSHSGKNWKTSLCNVGGNFKGTSGR